MAKASATSDETPKKDWRIKFIESLSRHGNATVAARKAKISRQHAHRVRGQEPDFDEAWKEALTMAVEELEEEARRRAADGVLKPVWHKGEKCGTVREFSDTLLIFLLKGHAPEKYRDRQSIEHTGAGGGPLVVKVLGAGVSMEDI